MPDSLAAVVLGAGAGERLRPLLASPEGPLSGGRGSAGGRQPPPGASAWWAPVRRRWPSTLPLRLGPARAITWPAGRTWSVENFDVALGTAGGVAHLRPWLDDRPALVVNGDTWSTVELGPAVDGWDGRRVRVVVAGEEAELRPGVRILSFAAPPRHGVRGCRTGSGRPLRSRCAGGRRPPSQAARWWRWPGPCVPCEPASAATWAPAWPHPEGSRWWVRGDRGGRAGHARWCGRGRSLCRAGEVLIDAIRTPELTVLVR